ncbi:hypothetical protein BTO06_15635 [Tenacibaculum sp. SZ-18]|uniref:hypothetical protein n=1 Tax=Tenacibaculum sp. SZ-18 TaxID=754423 RepID=UPI000C2CF277|nr:hypothetical protein [Tenacibaculum sp. SZ-18]AUC16493.1 hypothetical protein BTO06_15635 [Tenacibaculum sp. SZ-18]
MIFKLVKHLLVIIFLTVFTQIGGVVYLLVIFGLKNFDNKIKLVVFLLMYVIISFVVVPCISPYFGRVRIVNSDYLQPRSFLYTLTNRNYVVPEMNEVLQSVAENYEKSKSGAKLIYLDANFPFFNGFPLLPHLSHNDGKKIDVTLMYKDGKGKLTNRKPSISGYGVYEEPIEKEYNQIDVCKQKGFWQYDFPKYLTFGRINLDLEFANEANKELINLFLKHQKVSKIFIEPHLKSRLKLNNSKIRFHGCQAVRHDDHIHVQLR